MIDFLRKNTYFYNKIPIKKQRYMIENIQFKSIFALSRDKKTEKKAKMQKKNNAKKGN